MAILGSAADIKRTGIAQTQQAIRRAVIDQIKGAAGVGGGLPAELQIAQQSLTQFPGGRSGGTGLRIPAAPVPGNRYAGVAQQVSKFQQQSATRQRRSDAGLQGGSGDLSGVIGSVGQQVAGQAAQNAALATNLQNKVRAAYATTELGRQSALAKSRYDQQIQQIKANTQAQQQLSFSMIQQLAAANIDPTPFLNNPIAAAVTLGRIRYARGSETGLSGPQLAQFSEAGIDPTQYPSMDAAWVALGQARAQQNQLDPATMGQLAPLLQEYLKQQRGG